VATLPYERQVRQAPVPGVRVSTDAPQSAFGGGPAVAGTDAERQRLAGTYQQAIALEQEKADAARLSEKRRALNEWEYANVYDQKTGALSKMGKDAFGIPEQLKTSYDKFTEEQGKDLATQQQRDAYQGMVEARRDHVMRTAYGHVNQQTRVAEEAEREQGTESAKDRAAMDPRNVPIELAIVRDNAMAKAQARGIDASLELRLQESDLHARVIKRMAQQGKSAEAKAYFAAHESALHDRDYTTTKDAVDKASMQGEASKLVVDAFTTKYERKDTGGNNWTVKETPGVTNIEEFRASLPKDLDPDVEKLAMTLARARLTDQAHAEAQRQDALFKSAWQAIKAGGVPDPLTMSQIDPQGEKAVLAYAKMRADGTKLQRSEPKVFAGFYSLTPEQLRGLTLEQMDKQIRPWMTEDDYEAAAKHWGAAHKDPEAFKSIMKEEEELLEGYKATGAQGIKKNDTMKTIEKDEDKSAGYMKFKQAVDAERKRTHEKTGKNPDDEKFHQIVQKTAYTMAKKMTVTDYGVKAARDVLNEIFPFLGYSMGSPTEVKAMVELTETDIRKRVIEMPWEFRQTMFNHVYGSGGVAKGTTFYEWENANRGRINAAYLAAELGAKDEDLYRIIMGKK
jgi:hypothetical protein